jgi:hypothetical protein
LFLNILKGILLIILGQNPETQDPGFLPARYQFNHRMPGPLLLESQGPFMQAMAGIGFHEIRHSQTPGRKDGRLGEKVDNLRISRLF